MSNETVRNARMIRRLACIAVLLAGTAAPALAETVTVAVAANFTEPAKEIAAAFGKASGHETVLSFGATGALYTQITQDAPYEVFLAADDERPTRAVSDGWGVAGSVFTYSIGKIVLYSADPTLVTGPETLTTGRFDKIAIANPQTAPYGRAAMETLAALGAEADVTPKIVQGTNIAQAFQFVQTGNAELGFVALSQLAGVETGSRWEVPADLHQPIRQDAVLLKKGEANEAAKAFLAFLKAPEAAAIIAKYGYATD